MFAWVPGHAGIRGNEIADCLAKTAIKERMSRSFIPYTDLYPKAQKYTKDLWQEEWNNHSDNKLFQIRPDLTKSLPFTWGNRKEETVTCRLRTGHTFITRSLFTEK